MAREKYRTVWYVYHFDGAADRVNDRKFEDFHSAMEALTLFPGKWSAFWTTQGLRKGNHYLGPEQEEITCEKQPSDTSTPPPS